MIRLEHETTYQNGIILVTDADLYKRLVISKDKNREYDVIVFFNLVPNE